MNPANTTPIWARGPAFFVWIAVLAFSRLAIQSGDWPTVHGNSEHTGRSEETLQFPLTLKWAVEFGNERISTSAEPITHNGQVFVATTAGSQYGFDAATGEKRFQDERSSPILSSPCWAGDIFVSADAGGHIVGESLVQHGPSWAQARRLGFSSSPVAFADGRIVIPARNGTLNEFAAVDGHDVATFGDDDGSLAPIRQTPALSDDRIFVTSEDLRLHCFNASTGKEVWVSEQMFGQTARDYYPVVVRVAGKKFIVVRTNPVLNMAQQIASDRDFLLQQAGVERGDWKKLDSWIKSPAAAGTPELISQEQEAVIHYLETNRSAQTFYAFDAETGRRAFTPPILWAGGCQGVGTPPAVTKEGKAVVLYRSAYGNWNHGVAPLVAIGLLNFETGHIEPLRHSQGPQPPWNTFWGTADEEQNFTIAGDDLIIVHQGTLARFNFKTHDLEKIWGERDTYGGFKSPTRARNEWHGPGRGGVAISNGRIFWITGSRLLCLGPEKPTGPPQIKRFQRPTNSSSARGDGSADRMDLYQAVDSLLSHPWAPLYVEPGLAGREFFFENSREAFIALSWALPQLRTRGFKESERAVRAWLADEWQRRKPFSAQASYPLNEGGRREWFQVPPLALTRLGNDKPSHPFGGVYAAWLYADRCNAWPQALKDWPEMKSAFADFTNQHPNFGQQPELYFNRYLASMMAYVKISDRANNSDESKKARTIVERSLPTLIDWWKDAGTTLTNFNGSSELDRFIQKGDKLSWAVFPHRHKLAIFQDMTPDIGDIIRQRAREAAARVWKTFADLAPTWDLQGEERQYHFGENFVDTPDFALSAFQAFAFIQKPGREELLKRVDMPFCKADLYYIQKLAIALEPTK